LVWTIAAVAGLLWGAAQVRAHDMAEMTSTATSAPATTQASPATVTLSTKVEDGKPQLVATVTLNGKPLENARVAFGAPRSFGKLILGTDVTLDDGTAAIAFPSDLPGDAQGVLVLTAEVQAPLAYAGARAQASLPGGKVHAPAEEPYPRALWAPQAPLGLILVISALVAGAWGTYLFVVVQLVAVRKGASG
jgi:hypothetical protein